MRTRKLPYPEWMLDEIVDKSIIPNLTSIPTTTKILFRCPQCKQEYSQTIHNHICSDNTPKQGCPYCSKQKRAESYSCTCTNNRKPYPQWFIDELVNSEDKERAKLGNIKADEHLLFCCPQCNKEYIQRVASHITLSTGEKKQGCPECGIKKQIESSRKTKELKNLNIFKPYPKWFINSLYLREDKEYAESFNFSPEEERQFYCEKHDLVYKVKIKDRINLRTYSTILSCPQCVLEKENKSSPCVKTPKNKIYPEWFIDELANEEDKEKARNGKLRTHDRVSFICPIHGEYSRTVTEHIILSTGEKKRGCPKCGYSHFYKSLDQKRNFPEWFIDELANEEDKEKARNGKLKVSDTVQFKCEKGHVYSQIIKSHIILSRQEHCKGCPICFPNRSRMELEIEEYIKSLGVLTEHKKLSSSLINKFELDIFIPELNIGIEYNGSYYHKTLPDDGYSKDRLYHNRKYYACKELGIRLISIFDVDWENKKDKIKNYLKDLLLPKQNKIYARKCIVQEINKEQANVMYNQYHLLGQTTVQSVSYGLFYNGELLSCMSFQKGRYKENKNPVWTLTRFVTKSGVVIIGGASKLLNQFEKEYHPDILITYSDNDYFSGSLYEKLGFSCLGDTKYPRYYWNYKNKELKREQTQLKMLSKKYPELYRESLEHKGNKEDYIMLKLGALKVFRSGHIKWIKKRHI